MIKLSLGSDKLSNKEEKNISYVSNNIRFTENKGQWNEPFLYKAKLGNGVLFVEKKSFTYHFYNADKYHFHNFKPDKEATEELKTHAFRINFLAANKNSTVTSKKPFPEYYNYFLSKNPENWKSNVKAYQQIHYTNIYNNIDLTIYSSGNSLKYDVIVNPNGQVKDVQFQYEGHDQLSIDKNGNLHIATSVNEITEQKPYAYQLIDGKKIEVPCKFVLKENTLSFKMLKGYKKKYPLIIDPLIFASYSGSTADNFGMTATYGFDGSLFAGGTAFNIGYPTTLGAFDPNFHGAPSTGITDVVISRYNASGTNLIYSTYIGGTQAETVHSLIANENDELFLYGVTGSSDFPVTPNAYDTSFNGGTQLRFVANGTFFNNGTDIYVAKLNGAGTSLLGCTYIGGSLNDGINHTNVLVNLGGTLSPAYDSLQHNYSDQYRGEIILDTNNNCYVASSSRSSNFPTVNGFDNTLGGIQDGVVFKFDANLSNLIWSSYLGGSSMDASYSIKVDTNNIVYVAGGTTSNDFPVTAGTIVTTYQGGIADGYIAKINSNGSAIMAATYLGTNSYDQCFLVDIDRFGAVYTVGQTEGTYPIINATYSNPGSGQFIQKMNNNLSAIDYSTVFGNGNINSAFSPAAFLVDRCENVYVSGWGGNILNFNAPPLTGMPTTANALQPTPGDGFNFYLFVMQRNAQSLLYGSYFGGNRSQEHVDGGTSRFDKNGIVYQSVCAGCGNNDDFPTTSGVWSRTNNSNNCNNGVFKFDFEIIPKARFTIDKFEGCAPLTVTFTNTSSPSDTYLWDFGGGDTTSQIFNPTKTYTVPGVYNISLSIRDSICNTVDTAFQTVTVSVPVTISGGDTTTTCDSTTLTVSTTGNPTTFVWSTNNQFTDTLNTNLSDSSLVVHPSDTTRYYVKASNGPCSAIESFLVNYPGFNIEALGGSICEENADTLGVINSSGQTLSYSWTPTASIISGATTENPIVNPTTTTTYTVTAQNSFGCSASDTAVVIVSNFDPNSITLTSDKDTLYKGEGTFLHVTPNSGFTYLWSPSSSLSSPAIPDPFATPPVTTTYTVNLREISSGCSAARKITLVVYEINCDEPDLFIPNAFTPNLDKENDVLFVRGDNVEKMILKIYDRWGELIFETNRQSNGWDGKYKDKLVDPGVFVYYLEITCIDGQEYFKKGNITVIR